jgi:YD repeat-containing protein
MGNPIDSGTGNKFQREMDFMGQGVFPLQATRIYNSGGASPEVVNSTSWGAQWRGNYDRSIGYYTNTVSLKTAFVKRPNGKTYNFTQAIGTPISTMISNSTWTSDSDVVGSLTLLGVDSYDTPLGWMYVNENDETEMYDGNGNLLSITNRQGLTQTLTYSDGTNGPNGGYVLDANGNPTPTVLPPGLLIRVTDPMGRTLKYGYDSYNRVTSLTNPAGAVIRYGYDANQNLSSITQPDGTGKTYLYGEANNVSATPNAGVTYTNSLTGIVDGNGNRFASWTYDSAGLATSSEHGAFGSGIEKVALSYVPADPVGNSATYVTDVRGITRTYNFGSTLGVVNNGGILGQPCANCFQSTSLDLTGNVIARTDFNGVTTCRTYDQTRNLEIVRLEGLAPQPGTTTPSSCPSGLTTYTPSTAAGSVERKITTQWHATFRLPTSVAEPLKITTYTYDAHGNALSISVQPTSDTTGGQGFNASPAGSPRIWTYTYNAAGQILSANGPRTDVQDVTTYTYDGQGNLVSVRNALNQTTTLGGYDAIGRVGSITDPNGLVTTLTYDLRGRLTSRSQGGETTAYTYDGAGNLTNVSLPSGASYTYTYDQAHRLTQIADPQGNRIVYTLDATGNRTQEQVLNNLNTVVKTHSRVFDTLNHLVQDIGAVNQNTAFTYDANGNLLTSTDPLNRTTSNTYDALNRLIQATNPDTGVIKYAYDGQDQLYTVTDPRNLVTTYTRNGLGNLSQQQSPDTGATNITYDAAGNPLTRTDAKGQVATYTWDALNRVTSITWTGGTAPAQTVSYQYDVGVNGIGHLTRITDSTGVTAYAFDLHGRLATETKQAYGGLYTTAYAYDAQGRLTSMTYPSGREVKYTYDTQGRVTALASVTGGVSTPLASNIAYEPFGPVHSFAYGDGVTAPVSTYTRNRDQDGRIANYTLNGGSRTMSILYDAASQITTLSDSTNLANPASFTYDPMSRLTGYTQNTASQGFTYDLDGNRIGQTIGMVTTVFGYGAASNWLTGIQAGGGAQQAVAHDANGATTLDPTKNNQYAYDLRGRLVQTTTAQGVVNYEINAQGLRTRKQDAWAGGADTQFHYDAAGHLIAEGATGTATFAQEYVWLGDIPVAVLK